MEILECLHCCNHLAKFLCEVNQGCGLSSSKHALLQSEQRPVQRLLTAHNCIALAHVLQVLILIPVPVPCTHALVPNLPPELRLGQAPADAA